MASHALVLVAGLLIAESWNPVTRFTVGSGLLHSVNGVARRATKRFRLSDREFCSSVTSQGVRAHLGAGYQGGEVFFEHSLQRAADLVRSIGKPA